MLWITDSMGRFWQAYKDGLILSCPIHCAKAEEERKALEQRLMASREKSSRSFH